MQVRLADTQLPFNLVFHPLQQEGLILRSNRFEVGCFRVFHRIECWGFIFRQVKPLRKLNPLKAREYEIPASFFDRLKWGEDYHTRTGTIIENAWVTDAASKPKSYAYSADTAYNPAIAAKIKGVDLLYHESTYLQDLEERAAKRFHSTTAQAAEIAMQAGVNKLLIGHFSSKYEKLDEFEREAKLVFPNTEVAVEGVTYRV